MIKILTTRFLAEQKLNYRHEKNKRKIVKRAFGLEGENDFLIDLERALENFEKAETPFDFESSVEYLKLTGDLVRCGSAEKVKFITRPYYVFNQLLCRTLFRPRLDEWLNYEENLLFHFSGFYPTKESFEVDREKILRRGQFSWSMLKLLFIDESRTNEEFLIRFAYLVEDLRVGFVEESNSNCEKIRVDQIELCSIDFVLRSRIRNAERRLSLLPQ